MVVVVVFILAALLGAMLLSAAVVVWLGNEVMSTHLALFVVGYVYVVIAAVVYHCYIKRMIERWRGRLDVVYKVSAMFDTLYLKAMAIIKRFVGDI